MAERASMFDAADFDVSDFETAKPAARPKPDKVAIKADAEKRGFKSREPANTPEPTAAAAAAAPARQRRHVTGRNKQLNLKVTDDSLQRFYALADAKGWVLGEAFEHAIAALERDLKAK